MVPETGTPTRSRTSRVSRPVPHDLVAQRHRGPVPSPTGLPRDPAVRGPARPGSHGRPARSEDTSSRRTSARVRRLRSRSSSHSPSLSRARSSKAGRNRQSCDRLSFLLGHGPWGSMQFNRIHERTLGEPHPVGVEGGALVRAPRSSRYPPAVAVRRTPRASGDAIHVEGADLHGAALGARLHRIRFEPVERALRAGFGLELDDRTEEMRRAGHVLVFRRTEHPDPPPRSRPLERPGSPLPRRDRPRLR